MAGITGKEIRETREKLGLSATALAWVLWVFPSTVYRWEAAKEPPIDPLQAELLRGLIGIAKDPSAPAWAEKLFDFTRIGSLRAIIERMSERPKGKR